VKWDILLESFSVVGQMSFMLAGERTPPVVELSCNAEVKRGVSEQQMVTYQGGNRTQGDTECQKCH